MTSTRPVGVDELDALLDRMLLGNVMAQGRRVLGVEYERLILERGTGASAPLDACRELLARLVVDLDADPMSEDGLLKGLHTDEFDVTMEPGGQVEVASPPHVRLAEVDAVMARATSAMDAALAGTRYELACFGHAPVTPVDEIGLLPRERYRIMDARMPSRGPLTRNMMRATAGFQLTYDVEDADDAGRKLAMLFRLAPLLMALTANSARCGGQDTGYASFRHHVWWETDRDRSGVPDGCLNAETAVDGYRRYARRARMLFLERPGELVAAPDRSLEALVAEGQVAEADVALHLSSLFPFVRLRNYIEVRCFDSVEWSLARSILALVSGLVYCENAAAATWDLSAGLVPDDDAALVALHDDAARRALDAVSPAGRSFRALAMDLVGFARATLGGETCDWAQPDDLLAVEQRIRTG